MKNADEFNTDLAKHELRCALTHEKHFLASSPVITSNKQLDFRLASFNCARLGTFMFGNSKACSPTILVDWARQIPVYVRDRGIVCANLSRGHPAGTTNVSQS